MPLKSNLEQFIEAYISKLKNVSQLRSESVFLRKALAQINWYLDRECCEDPEASTTFARRDNELTTYIHSILNENKFDRRTYKRSLLRIKRKLENLLLDPCCNVFDDGSPPSPED